MSGRPCNRCKFDPAWESQTVRTIGDSAKDHDCHSQTETAGMSFLDMQKNDQDICTVKRWLQEEAKPKPEDISSSGTMVKYLWSQRTSLTEDKGLLYRKWQDHRGITMQAIVPMTERRNVLEHCHDHRTSGHLGVKTLSKVRHSFY